MYDVRFTMYDLDASALARGIWRSECGGGRREHGAVVVGKGRGAAGAAYLRFTIYDVRFGRERA